MALLRLVILVCTSLSTVLGGSLGGKVLCLGDGHVAIETPHAAATATEAASHTAVGPDHAVEQAAAEDHHGRCHDLSPQLPTTRVDRSAGADLDSLAPVSPLLAMLTAASADLPPSCVGPFAWPDDPDPWGTPALRTVVLLT